MREEDMGGRWVTIRLKSPKQAEKVRRRLNGTYIGDKYIEVTYEVDSDVRRSSTAYSVTSSSHTDVSSAVSLSMPADHQAKGKGPLKKAKSTRSTKTEEVSIGPHEAAWVLLKNIHRDTTQAKFEEAMRELGAIMIPGLNPACFGRVCQNKKVRSTSSVEATQAVARLPDEGLDGHPVDAWLSANAVPYMAVPQVN